MGKTIAEKIIAKCSGKDEVSVGDYAWINPRCPVTMPFTYSQGAANHESLGFDRVYDPERIRIVHGHAGVANSLRNPENTKRWARWVGIPERNIFDLDRGGIEHVTSEEHCWPLPGEFVVEVVNSHTCTRGALGAFAMTLSYEKGVFLLTGRIWVQVPDTTKVNITGVLQKGVTARDVSEYVLGQIGGDGAVGTVMEWTGPVVDAMDMDGRFTMCSSALFFGAWTAIMNPDEKTLEYVRARTQEPFEPLTSDSDARFIKAHNFDGSKIEPQIVVPPSRQTVKPLSELMGMKINRGFIGTCMNGRLDDMRLAAAVLKGKKVQPGVMLNITPATVNIYRQCLNEGIIDAFLNAGVVVPWPSCGMCGSQQTPLLSGDICVTTGPLNYKGHCGSDKAEIYLANPATVAASCIEGRIADPRDYL
ncbi:aconitase family protein [Chloroflexota bacterium]